MSFDEFFAKYNGKKVDFDGAYGAQCFDLFQFYNRDVIGGKFVSGAVAADIWRTFPTNLYTQIPNTPNNMPKKGDVVIWSGRYNGGAGHVGISTGASALYNFDVFEQNDPLNTASHVKSYKYDYVLGWLRPKVNEVSTGDDVKLNNIKRIVDGSGSPKEKIGWIRDVLR